MQCNDMLQSIVPVFLIYPMPITQNPLPPPPPPLSGNIKSYRNSVNMCCVDS